jgi:hypothetical protein
MTYPKPRNGIGTAGFVCGLIGFAGSVIPVVGLFTWIVGMVGVGLCSAGRGRVGQGVASNYGMCVAGTILALCGLVLSMATACIYVELH